MEIMNSEERFLIKGLSGKKKLNGSISVGGSKNAVLKFLASSILFKDKVYFENVPDILDVRQIVELIKDLGGEIDRLGEHSYSIYTSSIKNKVLNEEIAKKIRASIVLTGPLLSRFKKVSFPHPGGCVIGERPIDLFLESFKKMGAKVEEKGKQYILSAPQGLSGAKIVFKTASVTGTETIMMSAVLANGETLIENAATEPEIKHLADFLVSKGASIEGAGTSLIKIKGGNKLINGSGVHQIPPDRIEAGSFLILGAISGNNIEIENCSPEELSVPIEILRQSGIKIQTTKKKIILRNNGRLENKNLKPVNVKTHEYPGFPTDLQAPISIFLTQVGGDSLVFETIFEGRLNYVEDLIRMGANILPLDTHRVLIKGPTPLRGRDLESPDLRAGLAFLMAGIVAKGESILNNVHYIDRGYEAIEKRLRKIGVEIERVR